MTVRLGPTTCTLRFQITYATSSEKIVAYASARPPFDGPPRSNRPGAV